MMGDFVTLTAEDGHKLGAYVAPGVGTVKGAIVIIQEIFGVNSHIQSVCDSYAKEGYTAIAPAMFDRLKAGVELNYDQEGVQEGLELMNQIAPDVALKDIAAAKKHVDSAGNVSVMGYCWGGALTFFSAASDINFFKAVGYYGGGIPRYIDLKPQIPVLLHFGEKDTAIPVEQVEALKEAHPEVEIHLYDAGHGFNCDARESYDKPAADLARARSLAFLKGA